MDTRMSKRLCPFSIAWLPASRLTVARTTARLCIGIILSFGFVASQADTEARDCQSPEKINATVTLDGGCVYRKSLSIRSSNTHLDCKGAVLSPQDDDADAILIKGEGIRDVTVRNCRIQKSPGNGVRITAQKNNGSLAALPSLAERYAEAPSRVTLSHIEIEDAARSGIYIDDYVTHTIIEDVSVSRSGSVAVYLDQSSTNTTIRRSKFSRNGHGTANAPRKGRSMREAIAVDSSSHNVIVDNAFVGNAAGGIFLYKNCHEKASTNPNSAPRWMPSTNNELTGNSFSNEKTAIWIASRQSRDLSNWDCGDSPYGPGYYRDAAPNNRLEANFFVDVGVGIRVEDDGTQIRNNSIDARKTCVHVGSGPRFAYLNKPVINTVLLGNSCGQPSDAGYVFTDGAVPLIADGNAPADIRIISNQRLEK